MYRISLAFALTLAVLALGLPATSAADQGGVVRFATLPKPGPGFPEGIAADRQGNIYVATFDFTQPNVIYVFGRNGQVQTTIPVPGVPLGLEFNAAGNLYVANFGGGEVLEYTPPFTAGSTPARRFTVCAEPTVECALNAITFDASGNLYVSDSFGGRIFKIDLPGGAVSTFFEQPDPTKDNLLAPGNHGFPPFGANGLAFDTTGANLYIANTADDRILKMNVATKKVDIFAESINGADGIAFDASGLLWVAANQADEVVALNASGRVVERRGSFEGIGNDGAVKGLLFPASIVLSRGNIFVTNLALPLPGALEPEQDVKTYTVSRIPLGGN